MTDASLTRRNVSGIVVSAALAVFILSFPAICFSRQISQKKSSDVSQFQRQTHFSSYAKWNPTQGEIRELSGFRIPMGPGTPNSVARAFLSEYGPSLGLVSENYRISGYRDSVAGGRRVFFQEYDGDDPVSGFGLVMGINRPHVAVDIQSGSGDLPFSSRSPDGFSFYRVVGDPVHEAFRMDWYVYFISRIYPESSQQRLASQILSGQPGIPVHHANSNITVAGISHPPSRYPVVRTREESDCISNDFSATAMAELYTSNPIHGDPEQVSLENLCRQSPLILDGKHVGVVPDIVPRSTSTTGDFRAEKESAMFDEATAYYHIDQFVSLMKDSGMYSIIPDDYKISAIVRSTAGFPAAARFNFTTVLFADVGFPFLNTLLESAVIAHEVTHLLMFDLYSPSYLGLPVKEHFVMGEAFADYVGIAYRARQLGHSEAWRFPVMGSYFVLETIENLPRDLTDPIPNISGWNTTNYVGTGVGVSVSNVYDNAMIYSTSLMEYDRSDGSDYSLSFVIESLSNIGSNTAPNFTRGQMALIQAVNECALIKAPDLTECCDSSWCATPVLTAFASHGMAADELPVGIEQEAAAIPDNTLLTIEGNYPSPFPLSTTIVFRLSDPSDVEIRIFDLQGREVQTLAQRYFSSGKHKILWHPGDIPNGMYFYEIVAGNSVQRKAVFYVR